MGSYTFKWYVQAPIPHHQSQRPRPPPRTSQTVTAPPVPSSTCPPLVPTLYLLPYPRDWADAAMRPSQATSCRRSLRDRHLRQLDQERQAGQGGQHFPEDGRPRAYREDILQGALAITMIPLPPFPRIRPSRPAATSRAPSALCCAGRFGTDSIFPNAPKLPSLFFRCVPGLDPGSATGSGQAQQHGIATPPGQGTVVSAVYKGQHTTSQTPPLAGPSWSWKLSLSSLAPHSRLLDLVSFLPFRHDRRWFSL